MIVEIICVAIATVILILGLMINGLILCYLRQKGPGQKTSFDLVLIDKLWVVLLQLCTAYTVLILGLLEPSLSYPVFMIIATVASFSMHYFCIVVLVAVCFKIAFIKDSANMLEQSDTKIRLGAILTSISLMALVYLLNHIGQLKITAIIFEIYRVER